jgi:hypothetical protein
MITKENVKVFVVEGLGYLVAEVVIGGNCAIDGITLKHPFRLNPNSEGAMSVGPIFVKEEFATINPGKIIAELDIEDVIYDLYVKYDQKIWSSIIVPDSYNNLKLV